MEALTQEETDYILQITECDKELLSSTVYNNLPELIREDMNEKLGDRFEPPNRDTFVFAKIESEEVELEIRKVNGEDDVIEAKRGDIWILPYSSVKQKVEEGTATLM